MIFGETGFILKVKVAGRKATRGPPARTRRLGVAARARAGLSRDGDRVWRRVVSGKVAERNPLCTFVTDVSSWNGTHSDVCCPECQLGAHAIETAISREGSMCRSLRDATSVTKLQSS